MTITRIAVCLVLAALPVAAQRPPVIENEQVRVLVVTDEPHRKNALHEHLSNRVMIYLDAGANTLTYADGRVDRQKFQSGEVRWSPAGGKHSSENPGDKAFRVVEVELKNAGRPVEFPALDPVKIDPKHYQVVMDNPQVRVVRARIGPKEKVPMHEHALPRVLVFLTDFNSRAVEPDGKDSDIRSQAREERWGGPAKHREENLREQTSEVVVIEIK